MLDPLPFGVVEHVEAQPGRRDRGRRVDADDLRQKTTTERDGDRPTPIAPVSEEAVVPESAHELDPRTRNALGAPSLFGGLVGVAESRERRHHDAERRGRGILRLGELIDDVDELGDAPRPAVGQDERGGIRPRRTAVEEMDAEPADVRAELTDLVQPALERPPVIGGAPLLDQLDDVGEGWALLPPVAASRVVGCRRAFGESRRYQACAQRGEVFVGGVRLEVLEPVRRHLAADRIAGGGA